VQEKAELFIRSVCVVHNFVIEKNRNENDVLYSEQ
jgi:hypothetical protein